MSYSEKWSVTLPPSIIANSNELKLVMLATRENTLFASRNNIYINYHYFKTCFFVIEHIEPIQLFD